MPDLVLYGWPAVALTIAATGFGYFWIQSRRLDRLDARERAEAASRPVGGETREP